MVWVRQDGSEQACFSGTGAAGRKPSETPACHVKRFHGVGENQGRLDSSSSSLGR